MLEKLELSRIRSPCLEVEDIFELTARHVETLKSVNHPNLKDDAITSMRHPCPNEHMSTHEAPGSSFSVSQ
jgi:hypothetical protein